MVGGEGRVCRKRVEIHATLVAYPAVCHLSVVHAATPRPCSLWSCRCQLRCNAPCSDRCAAQARWWRRCDLTACCPQPCTCWCKPVTCSHPGCCCTRYGVSTQPQPHIRRGVLASNISAVHQPGCSIRGRGISTAVDRDATSHCNSSRC